MSELKLETGDLVKRKDGENIGIMSYGRVIGIHNEQVKIWTPPNVEKVMFKNKLKKVEI